jgi:hypothetical protein
LHLARRLSPPLSTGSSTLASLVTDSASPPIRAGFTLMLRLPRLRIFSTQSIMCILILLAINRWVNNVLFSILNKRFYSRFSGCHSYSLPRHIQPHVDLIEPTVHLKRRPTPRTGRLGRPSSGNIPKTSDNTVADMDDLNNCTKQITPDCLRALYKIDYKPCSTDKNTFGIGSLRCL